MKEPVHVGVCSGSQLSKVVIVLEFELMGQLNSVKKERSPTTQTAFEDLIGKISG